MSDGSVVVWLRQDLRLSDHPALAAAADSGRAVVPVFVLDDETPGPWKVGGASRWWLHHSLEALAATFAARGTSLVLRRGKGVAEVLAVAREAKASAIHLTRAYEPYVVADEAALKSAADAAGIAVRRFSGSMLFEPEGIRNKQGEPFRVFTPFWKCCLEKGPPGAPLPAPAKLSAPSRGSRSEELAGWNLLPTKPDWAGGLRETWTPGEAGARERLQQFVKTALAHYKDGRDRPDKPYTSMLSPHLHFGEISLRQCWEAANHLPGGAPFLREIGWREFSTHLLFNFPTITDEPFRPEFAKFPWRTRSSYARDLNAWQKGLTGYPIVDAGMRQLWYTGWMHNRVRMIVASLLTKHLRIPWQEGERWFWDTLVDADLANNSASWQWVAGSGADAAPYFRIFNPIMQGEKFDPEGDYVRRWVPELARMPSSLIHKPWEAPALVMREAGVTLGASYPHPIVDHGEARAAALAAYEAVKAGGS